MTRPGGWLGTLEVLFITLLVLKLSKVADWSWWVVLTPILLAAVIWIFDTLFGRRHFIEKDLDL